MHPPHDVRPQLLKVNPVDLRHSGMWFGPRDWMVVVIGVLLTMAILNALGF